MSRVNLSRIIIVAFILFILAVPRGSRAATGASIAISSIAINGDVPYVVTVTPTVNDGSGYDDLAVVCYNADGGVSDVDFLYAPLPTPNQVFSGTCGRIFTHTLSLPMTAVLFDVGHIGPIDENTPGGLAFALTGTRLASATGTALLPGPGVPAGFVLRTISCTSPVYDSAGGTPVGSNQVFQGQRWFVSPTAAKDAQGRSWTEIFVAGYTDGFIPSRCVASR